jgi:MFS family permease
MSPLAGLAALNFFMADVQGGLGPFLATWLAAVLHWDPARIGLVITISGIAGLVFNGPAGALVDRMGRPRLLLALAAVAIVGGSLALVPARNLLPVLISQISTAAGGSLMAPALTALTLGIVGKERFPAQQGNNQAWNHAGNVVAALLVAGGTFALGAASAFWVLGGMAILCLASLPLIPTSAIAADRISGHTADEASSGLFQVLKDWRVLALALMLLLFHLGNAAMLPLLGQRLAAIGHGNATRWMAACIIVAQLAMIPIAMLASRAADRIDRAWLLVAACAVLPVRGLLAAWSVDPAWLIPVEILDACGAGTLGVAIPILVADFTWGSGRTQTVLGVVATFQGIGASLSASLGGVLATWFGWPVAFLGLGLPALFALALAFRLLRTSSGLTATTAGAPI